VADEASTGERPLPRQVVKDMAITHADFFRTLRPLLQDLPHELTADGAQIELGGGRVEIRLGAQGHRALGNFRLPRTLVELRFDGCPQHVIDDFIAGFDRRFRRGGG